MKAISDDEYARGLKILAQEQLIPSDQFDKLMTMVDILSRSSVSPTKKWVGKNVSWRISNRSEGQYFVDAALTQAPKSHCSTWLYGDFECYGYFVNSLIIYEMCMLCDHIWLLSFFTYASVLFRCPCTQLYGKLFP